MCQTGFFSLVLARFRFRFSPEAQEIVEALTTNIKNNNTDFRLRPSSSPHKTTTFVGLLMTVFRLFTCLAFLGSCRAKQNASCLSDLIAADFLLEDSILSEIEYTRFVTSRFDCYDSQNNLTVAQHAAFFTLACSFCLGTGSFTAIPNCCLPENATIPFKNLDEHDTDRICTAAEVATEIDCPSPTMAPSVMALSSIDQNEIMEANTIEGCEINLVAADSQTDGFLSATEFRDFLRSYTECADDGDVFQTLSCASCLPETGDLSCCSAPEASISIEVIATPVQQRSVPESVWLNRICLAAASHVLECNSTVLPIEPESQLTEVSGTQNPTSTPPSATPVTGPVSTIRPTAPNPDASDQILSDATATLNPTAAIPGSSSQVLLDVTTQPSVKAVSVAPTVPLVSERGGDETPANASRAGRRCHTQVIFYQFLFVLVLF